MSGQQGRAQQTATRETEAPADQAPFRSRVIRDAVTGERLTDEDGNWLPTAGCLFIRVRPDLSDPTPSASACEALERELPPLPAAVDSSQVYPGGRLGGRAWTSGWKRRIGTQTTAAAQAERDAADDAHTHWWRSEYAKEKLLRGFQARYGPVRGAEYGGHTVAALEAPDYEDEIAKRAGKSLAWLDRQKALARRICLSRYRAS